MEFIILYTTQLGDEEQVRCRFLIIYHPNYAVIFLIVFLIDLRFTQTVYNKKIILSVMFRYSSIVRKIIMLQLV